VEACIKQNNSERAVIMERSEATKQTIQNVVNTEDQAIKDLFGLDLKSPFAIAVMAVAGVILLLMLVAICQLCSVHRKISAIARKGRELNSETVELAKGPPGSPSAKQHKTTADDPDGSSPIQKRQAVAPIQGRRRGHYESREGSGDGESYGVWAVNQSKQPWRESFYNRVEAAEEVHATDLSGGPGVGYVNRGASLSDEVGVQMVEAVAPVRRHHDLVEARRSNPPRRDTPPAEDRYQIVSRNPRHSVSSRQSSTAAGAIPRATAAAVASQAQAKQGKRRGVDYDYTY